MKPPPFRLKIALLSAMISGVVLVGFGSVSWYLIYQQRLAAVDREIRTLSSRHPGWFANRGNYERLTSSLEFTFGEERKEQVILLIRDAAGQGLYRSPHWPPDLDAGKLDLSLPDDPKTPAATALSTNAETHARPGPPWAAGEGAGRGGMGRGYGPGRGSPPPTMFSKATRFITVTAAGSTWRLGVLGNDEITLVVGLSFNEAQGELERVRNAFLLTLPVALFLVGFGGWLVAGRALKPMRIIAATAEQVTARGLDQRIPPSDEDPEIARVIHVLNRMMDRLEASFRQATRFSADASHELKTPLAIMQGELENALQAAAPGSREQQVFSSLLEETQRLKTITRSLLLLAQADAGQLKLALEPVDLSAELEGMIEDARVLAAGARLSIEAQVQPELRLQADRALLHTALFNLIGNAIKYNEPDGQVSLKLEAAGGQAVFTIANTGPGIPAAEQPKIFDRFYRADRGRGARVDGIGLGLSLAREIVRAHGGELVLKESKPGWTCFELRLKSG